MVLATKCPHTDRKHAGNGLCRPCYQKQWKSANRDKVLTYNATYDAKTAEKRSERNKARYQKDRDKFLAYQQAHKKEIRLAGVKRNYNLTAEAYESLLKEQGYKCAGCRQEFGEDRQITVDHDHSCCSGLKSCGKCVRGLLCHPCNRSLGLLKEDPYTIINLLAYVKGATWNLLPNTLRH